MKNKEIKLFEKLFLSTEMYFNNSGYFLENKKAVNEGSSEECFISTFFNKKLEKEITFIFFPSKGKDVKNRITVGFAKIDSVGNISSMNIPKFLAYKELNRKIRYEDTEKYWFKVDPKRLEESIQEQLAKIIALLNTDLHKIFTTDEWIDIPTHDPRDDY